MIRLFYLVSSIDSAKEISDDLHEHDVVSRTTERVLGEDGGIRVVCHENRQSERVLEDAAKRQLRPAETGSTEHDTVVVDDTG